MASLECSVYNLVGGMLNRVRALPYTLPAKSAGERDPSEMKPSAAMAEMPL